MFILFFLRNNKKIKNKNSFMASYLHFRKNLDRGKDTFYENFQKTENYSKNVTLAWKTLKFGFLYFWKSCRELNFLSRNANIESIRIFSRKLDPKYEIGANDNTNSASSSTFFQNFKWGSIPNLFKLI